MCERSKLLLGPDENKVHPNENVPSVCFIKNIIKNPNIIVGDFTYYDDAETGGEDFEAHVVHLYPFLLIFLETAGKRLLLLSKIYL